MLQPLSLYEHGGIRKEAVCNLSSDRLSGAAARTTAFRDCERYPAITLKSQIARCDDCHCQLSQ